MSKRWFTLFLSLFPLLAFAQDDSGTMSLAPPASDYSIVFLGNLFGVVDGVLHSSGSQIMGAIFTVFNSAVLALGGIVIMYTLMVSTMNTAHEGQMLGQKWSSIWIPVRSTLGLALLIPKASGYCLMQIFVMWVVTQGVGAADKVWAAALSYLNRGGVIIQAQPNPGTDLLASLNGGAFAVPSAAYITLAGQVCMLGIQKQLEAQRTDDMKPTGRCNSNPVVAIAQPLCDEPVPDFLSSIDFVDVQQKGVLDSKGNYTMNMPNFTISDPNSKYKGLDGICGFIKWKPISALAGTPTTGQTQYGPSASELETAQLTRAIAIQQMFVDLSSVTQIMINNDPQMASTNNSNNKGCALIANQQYGVPYDSSGAICPSADLSNPNSNTCTTWGPANIGLNSCSGGTLFNGTEFSGAITDYNGVMKPTLNLIRELQNSVNGIYSRAFIAQANEQGWITAGSYFFDLVNLNGSSGSATGSATDSGLQDTNNGMEQSVVVDVSNFNNAQYPLLGLLQNNKSATQKIEALIDGIGLFTVLGDPNSATKTQAPPKFQSGESLTAVTGPGSLTVNGFVNNSLMVKQPGEPGFGSQLNFAQLINFTPSSKMYYLQPQSFGCGSVTTFIFTFCLGGLLGDVFYNLIIMIIFNAFIFFFQQILQQIVMAFVMIPLQALAQIFQSGMQTISVPGVNPVIALANMGVMYINFAGNLWIITTGLMMTFSIFGPFILAVLVLIMPLFAAWVSMMVSIGFLTAYYIPILPYMIFTFGSIAWLIAVIEAMVAAPIVALGVTHPEGHDAFGKGEAAIMLLMNVFLRPAMMIIGYISGIALSYVSVWILNAGFQHAIAFIQTPQAPPTAAQAMSQDFLPHPTFNYSSANPNFTGNAGSQGSGTGGYQGWASIFAYFFSILIYTTMYITVVQKAFTLIAYLPDKVLRWIGGSPESLGTESAQWGDEMVKGKLGDAAKETGSAQGKMGEQLGGHLGKGIDIAKGKLSQMLQGGKSTMKEGDDDSGGKGSGKGSGPGGVAGE